MIGPRPLSQHVAREIFGRAWSVTATGYDHQCAYYTVNLAIGAEELQSMLLDGNSYNRLSPNIRIKKCQARGVRFHGRVVGRRA